MTQDGALCSRASAVATETSDSIRRSNGSIMRVIKFGADIEHQLPACTGVVDAMLFVAAGTASQKLTASHRPLKPKRHFSLFRALQHRSRSFLHSSHSTALQPVVSLRPSESVMLPALPA